MKKIIFSGDSFTWGESIELENENYLKLLKSGDVTLDKGRHQYMGYNHAHFHDIASNVYSIEHRTKYRFPTLVSKHFNAIGYIKEYNGGANQVNIDSLFNFVNKKSKIDLIVFQMTHCTRDLAHNYYHGTYNGVPHTNDKNIGEFLQVVAPMWMTFDKDTPIDDLPDFIFKDAESKCSMWTVEQIKDVIKHFDEDSDKWWLYHYEESYKVLVEKIEAINDNMAPVLIIGTWNDYDDHMEKKLPLSLQLRLNKFKVKISGRTNLFEYIKTIEGSDYTCPTIKLPELFRNHHPTTKTHRAIAQSLISAIEKKKLL